MRVTYVFATTSFHLILEFNNREYRLLNIKEFLKSDTGLLADVRDDLGIFRSAKLDKIAGTVVFDNGVDFDVDVLWRSSENIDRLFVSNLSKSDNETSGREKNKTTWKEIEYKGAVKALVATIAHNLVVEEDVSIDVVARALGLNEETVEEFVRDWDY